MTAGKLLTLCRVVVVQDHARAILPHLTALAGNEGADAWIRETMNIFNACISEDTVVN